MSDCGPDDQPGNAGQRAAGGKQPAQRIAVGLEYDGGPYSGWQRQRHAPSIQEALERALSQVAGAPVRTVAAGRTDAGVHATQQVVSFATKARRPLKAWREGVNTMVGDSIKVRWAKEVDAGFHARHSARARRYMYLFRMDAVPAPLADRYAWRVAKLRPDAMHRAGQCLVGEQDFTSFRAAGCQARNGHRNVHRLSVRPFGDLAVLDIEANAFLLHMVRNIAGTLVEVGVGARPASWAADCLAARDRRRAGKTAPAKGLYLVDVRYPGYAFPAGRAPPLLTGFENMDVLEDASAIGIGR